MAMDDETRELLVRLADERWKALRREHNRMFMAYGPGAEWERYKEAHAAEYREIELAQAFVAAAKEGRA